MDWIHKFTNWLSYNRYLALAVIVASVFLVLPACEFTATSPKDGSKKTENALLTDLQSETQRIKAKLQDAERMRDKAVADAERRRDSELRRIAEEYESSVADLTIEYQQLYSDESNNLSSFTEQTQDALAEIEGKKELLGGAFKLVDGMVKTLGVAAGPEVLGLWSGASTLIAAGLFGDNRRKNKKIAELQASTTTKV